MNRQNMNGLIIPDKKNIVVTYDDITRMVDFCKDEDGNITRDFYDWYLDEKGMYFVSSGILIIDFNINKNKTENKFAIHFDLSNPDHAEFEVYKYEKKYAIFRFSFNRQENLTMENVSFNMEYYNTRMYQDEGRMLVPGNINQRINRMVTEISKQKKISKTDSKRQTYRRVEREMTTLLADVMSTNCRVFIYYVYATLYYLSKRKPRNITTTFNKSLSEGEIVKGEYKYTGYVDLREYKTYTPIVPRNPNEPLREYQRHIEKWSVRGHYRRTRNGITWVNNYEKGDGTIEQRVYATIDESKLNLTSKTFEVTRLKSNTNSNTTSIPETEHAETLVRRQRPTIEPEKPKVNFFARIKKILKHYSII